MVKNVPEPCTKSGLVWVPPEKEQHYYCLSLLCKCVNGSTLKYLRGEGTDATY